MGHTMIRIIQISGIDEKERGVKLVLFYYQVYLVDIICLHVLTHN